MNQKVVTFGEIMLRLKSPGYERFFQSPALEATFGGSEANVSVSLANYGMDTAFVTVLPDHEIGDACLRELRGFGVDTSKIVRREGRMGVYYLETGAVQRPSKVIYDREGSVFCNARPGDFDWDSVFEGASWFHITGITPAISESAMELSLESVKEAKKRKRAAGKLRPELPQQSVEVRQDPRAGDGPAGSVCGYADRQRRAFSDDAGPSDG